VEIANYISREMEKQTGERQGRCVRNVLAARNQSVGILERGEIACPDGIRRRGKVVKRG